jgi:hypothetical protein
MVFHGCHLAACRQQVVEMATPAGGVLSGAPSACGGVIQNGFNPPSDPLGGLGLGCPYRGQNGLHMLGPHIGHRLVSKHGEGVGGQRGFPLFRVLGVLPGGAVRLDVVAGHGAERDGLQGGILRFGLGGGFIGGKLGEGINARPDQLQQHSGPFLGIRQLGCGGVLLPARRSAQTHLPHLAIAGPPELPEPRAVLPDQQIQAISQPMPPRLGVGHFLGCHRLC